MMQSWRKRFAPNGKRMIAFLVILLVVDLLLLAYLNRKPICFESALFNELEWVFPDGQTAKVYNCEANRKVPLTKVFIEKLSEIQKRLSQLDSELRANFLPTSPIKLSIHDGPAELLQIASDHLIVSESAFFNKELLLEKAFLKAWLQQSQKGAGLGLLRAEILTHFLMWNLGMTEKVYRQWQAVLGQWPQLATSWSGYCQSSIKDESYASICLTPSFAKRAEALTPFSLNFWLAQKLWQSFQVLSVKEQMEFFKKMHQFVEVLSSSEAEPLAEMNLLEIDQFARTEAQRWQIAFERIGFNDWGWNFSSKVASDLEAHRTSLGRIDLLVKKDRAWTADELLALQKIAIEEVNYRLMAANSEGLWGFPWLTPIREEAFPEVKAQNVVWITCEWPQVSELMEMRSHADKVILVQECSDKVQPIFVAGLLHRGIQFFSLDNKDSKFILLNLEALDYLVAREPSLLKKRLVTHEQAANKKNFLAAKASWTSALWNPKYRAYEVSATIDVVEWFKLPENVWPDFE